MASDLPTARWDKSADMARVLVQVLRSDEAVYSRIKEDFDHPPAVRTIAKYRAEWMARRQAEPVPDQYRASDQYKPAEVSDRLTRANAQFVSRLAAERAKSAIANQDYVNPKWRRVA